MQTMSRRECRKWALQIVRHYSRVQPPRPVAVKPVIRVSNNIAYLDSPKEDPKPRQFLSLPPFPAHPLPAKNYGANASEDPYRVTAISWLKYCFLEMKDNVVQSHFNKSLVHIEDPTSTDSIIVGGQVKNIRKINHSEAMKAGARIYVSVSIAETRISKRYDAIPSGTLYPNADEIRYLQRLVKYKEIGIMSVSFFLLSFFPIIDLQDSAILVLNKPPKLPVKGNLPVHNSMDALAAAALSYDYEEGPKLVHRLDRESSGLILMGRKKESAEFLQSLFTDINRGTSSYKAWNDACEATYQRYWALVIGCPKEMEGVISAPLSKVLLNDGKTERVMLTNQSGLEASPEAITEYRVLGPTVNGCSWIELKPLTYRKHQLRVHCAEALGTPIVGDYKYGWFVQKRWKQMPRIDVEPTTGKPYKLRRPEGLDVQKGTVLSKVPLLHLHCRELVLPDVAKFLRDMNKNSKDVPTKPDLLRFVGTMPTHMRISWNLMSSYLV